MKVTLFKLLMVCLRKDMNVSMTVLSEETGISGTDLVRMENQQLRISQHHIAALKEFYAGLGASKERLRNILRFALLSNIKQQKVKTSVKHQLGMLSRLERNTNKTTASLYM